MIYISHFTNEERKKYRQNNLPTVKQAEKVEQESKDLIF